MPVFPLGGGSLARKALGATLAKVQVSEATPAKVHDATPVTEVRHTRSRTTLQHGVAQHSTSCEYNEATVKSV